MEICRLCNEEATPWFAVKGGHICDDCYYSIMQDTSVTRMSKVYVVSSGSANFASVLQFAFYDLEEAEKFREYVDSKNGASSHHSTLHLLNIFDSANQLIKAKK
jgi:hypothetical protein